MFRLIAYTGSVGSGATAETPALQDGTLNIQSNHWQPSRDESLLLATQVGDNLIRGRWYTPSVRAVTTPWIVPNISGTSIPNDPNVSDYRGNPFRLARGEQLFVEATRAVATAANIYAFLVTAQRSVPTPRGDVYKLRGTSSTAAVVGAWTLLSVTWQDILPTGVYAVVGGVHSSATPLAFQTSFTGLPIRPGGLSTASEGARTHVAFMPGGLGVWGYFRQDDPPRIYVLCGATDASHVVYLDIIRVGDSMPDMSDIYS